MRMFDIRFLRWMLLINLGLCLLLTYKMFTMSLTPPGQVAELRALMAGEMKEKDRQSLLTKLFDFVEKREQMTTRLRNIVLRYALGMIPFFAVSLWFAFRLSDEIGDEQFRNSGKPETYWKQEWPQG